MGGLVSNVLSKVGQKVGGALESWMLKSEGSAVGREVNAFAGNQEWELNATPEGKIIKGYIEDAHRAELPILGKLDASRSALWNGIKADPSLVQKFDYANTDLSTIHNDLSSTNHPLASHSAQLLSQSPKNASRTLQDLNFQNSRQALLLAQKQVMGQNMERISPLIMRMRDSPNFATRELAQRYTDIISNEFRDKEPKTAFSKTGPVKGDESRTKVQLNKAFKTVNTVRQSLDMAPVPLLNTKPMYGDQGVTERALTDILRTVQTPLAAIPHASMEFNLAMAAPTRVLIKALAGANKADSDRIIQASHILAINDLEALNSDIAARTGKISKWTNSPTLGAILNKTFHIPGFNQLRNMQIRHAGAVGFQNALYWSGKLMQGSRGAEAELRAMHLNPAEVLRQGGQLTDEQLETAVYHFANDTMFLKKGLNMPLNSNKNWFMRSAYMYHFYVRNEAFFLQKTFSRMMKSGDVAGIGRFVSTLCILWPATAPLFDAVETFGRTGSLNQAGQKLQDDYGKLVAPSSPEEWVENYLGLLAHIGAVGTFMQYANSVKNYSLLKQFVGPKIATPVTYLQDAAQAARGQSAAPITRDLLQLIPLAGKPLSHLLEPTRKEEPKYSSSRHKSHKLKRR